MLHIMLFAIGALGMAAGVLSAFSRGYWLNPRFYTSDREARDAIRSASHMKKDQIAAVFLIAIAIFLFGAAGIWSQEIYYAYATIAAMAASGILLLVRLKEKLAS